MDYRFSLKLAQFDREADAALVIADYDNESQQVTTNASCASFIPPQQYQ